MAPGLDAVTADNKGTRLVYVGYWTSPQSVPCREINTHGPDPCRAWLPRLRYPTPGTSCICWQRCRVPVPLSDKWMQACLSLYYKGWTGIAVTKLRPALSGATDFSLVRNVQTVSEVHPVPQLLAAVGFFPGVKRPGRENDHFSLSTAKVKNGWSYTSTVPVWFHFVHRDFTFTPQQ
jgi:hypothetical protein